MNFLQLCKDLRSEAGISGDGPPAVTGQKGIYAKVVRWVKRAYLEVQNSRTNWDFHWTDYGLDLIPGQSRYDLKDYVNDYRRLDKESLFLVVENKRRNIPFVSEERFRELVPNVRQSSIPTMFTIRRDNKIQFDAEPKSDFPLELAYFKKPVEFVNNEDEPIFDSEFHEIVLYKALMYYAADEEAGQIFSDASQNYRSMLIRMELRYHQADFDMPDPLA